MNNFGLESCSIVFDLLPQPAEPVKIRVIDVSVDWNITRGRVRWGCICVRNLDFILQRSIIKFSSLKQLHSSFKLRKLDLNTSFWKMEPSTVSILKRHQDRHLKRLVWHEILSLYYSANSQWLSVPQVCFVRTEYHVPEYKRIYFLSSMVDEKHIKEML